jgi:predicted kinase
MHDPPAAYVSAPATSARLHLLLGPVGAGKSTYARRLCESERAVPFNLDAWMTRLFRPDRPATDVVPWYVERAARCVDVIWEQAALTLGAGAAVVLEIGLILRQQRRDFYDRVDDAGHPLVIHVVDAPREVRRARVLRRNEERGATFSMPVPLDFFERASDLWEPVEPAEAAGRDVRWVTS